MDIDAQDKHIRALLADNIELKAFKAWAMPILLAIEQGAALAAEEIEGSGAGEETETPVEQQAEEASTPVETEQAAVETEATPVPVEEVPAEPALVAEEPENAPQPEEQRPVA